MQSNWTEYRTRVLEGASRSARRPNALQREEAQLAQIESLLHLLCGDTSRQQMLLATYRQNCRLLQSTNEDPLRQQRRLQTLSLHLIEAYWYADWPVFDDDPAIERGSTVLSLLDPAPEAPPAFRFEAAPRNLLQRIGRRLRRRPRQPHSAGMQTLFASQLSYRLTNQVALAAARLSPQSPPLFASSFLRSIKHQTRLAELGYQAPTPSAHCAGAAADLLACDESQRAALAHIASELLHRGLANSMNEGPCLHLCFSPQAMAAAESAPLDSLGL